MLEPQWGSTEPPGVTPVKGGSGIKLIILAVVGLAMIVAAFLVPVPVFFAYLPGPVRDVERLVDIGEARTYSSEGTLLLTTVSVDSQVTVSEMVESAFDDSTAIVMKDAVTGGQSLDALIKAQKREIQQSKQDAQEVALAALGYGAPTGDGARVIATQQGAPAADLLKEGDVIVSVDGEPVQTTCEVGRTIDRFDVGDRIAIGIERDGKKETFQVGTVDNPQDPGSPIIGVLMEDVNREFDPGLEVTFDTGKIGGPSAGLMMSLALYDQLTPDDLTGGRKIAGTGTISCDGGVGAIGGIEQKIAGAEAAGAEIFLAPAGNTPAAKKVATDIEVVKVSSFEDALEYLKDLPAG